MNDGRKTRRFGGLSDKAREKAKLNREWQQISQVHNVHIPTGDYILRREGISSLCLL